MADEQREGHRGRADEARARANDLTAQAAEAHREADAHEARAQAEDAGVEYEPVDPLAGTWEGRVSGSGSTEGDGEVSTADEEDGA